MSENSLIVLKNANKLLAEVKNSKDAKNLMDMAGAAEHYAKKAKLGQEAIDYAHAIKIDAQSLLGKYLKETPRNEGGKPVPERNRLDKPPTLPELGLTRKESVASQFLNTLAENHPEEFEAIKEGVKTISEVQRQVKKNQAVEKIKEFPSKKYRIIYADPPWKYGDTLSGELSENYGGAEKHYPSMSISELCNLPVSELTTENAVLFLWVTSPLLFECEEIIKAWGFQYKASFIWDKVKHNMGHYNSVRHEFLLVCTKGSCTPDENKLFDSVQSIERTEKHSEKPEKFREIIDTIYPHGKRIELFARRKADGWDRWGADSEQSN